MPFDSRKQQKWYHATGQTFYDDKPHSARLVKKGGSKSEEGEDPEYKDLTTSAGGDLDPQNKNLQTIQGSTRESLKFEGKEYKLSPEGHIPEDKDLEFEDKIYTEVTHEDKIIKRDEEKELASEYTYKEMRESLLKNDVKQILRKAVEEFKEEVVDFTQNKDDVNKQWEFWQVDMETHKKVDDTTKIVKAEHYGQAIDDYIANWNTTHEDKTVGYPNVQGKLYNEAKAQEVKTGDKVELSGGEFGVVANQLPNGDWYITSKGRAYQIPEDQLKVISQEEGIASVSGPPADSTMRIMSNKTHVRPEEKFVDEIIDENLQAEDDLTSEDLTDKVLGEEKSEEDYKRIWDSMTFPDRAKIVGLDEYWEEKDHPYETLTWEQIQKWKSFVGESLEFEGEVYHLSPRGYSPKDKDLIFEGKIYKAQEGVGNCQFCAGKGQVTVENLGIKDCPDCDGTGEIQQSNLAPDITGQVDPNLQPQQPTQEVPQEAPQQEPQPDQPTQQGQIPQQPQPNEQPAPPQQAPEENKEKPKFGEAKTQVIACEKSMKQYRGYIAREVEVLKKRAKGNEAVSIMYGLPTISKQGKKIKGILAYAGVSLNDRIYLPEELSKGHGLTLPLLLNHSNIAGAEEELDRLDDDMVNHLENEKDFKIGEVTLDWDQEKLTLFYEGVIEHEFFQKEVDDADMAVSLGIYYDADSPVVCDENCYTIIKGAEFREVSLVYHPGFPIATIEAVENELKKEILAKQKAKEDHLEKLEQLKKNEEEEQAKGEDETKDIKLVNDVIEDVKVGGIAEETEEDIIITDDPETLDLVTQVPAEDWNEDIIATESNFSVRGINGFTISNSNGVTRYKLDPSNGYENNWLHVNVNKEGAKLYGEEFQLQPKMTTPPELTKEIESHPDLKFTDSDADAFNPKKKLKT